MNNSKYRIPLTTALIVIVILSLICWWLYSTLHLSAPNPGSGQIEIEISEGMNLNGIADLLSEKKLIDDGGRFKWAARIMGAERKLQPGRFLLPYGATNTEIIRKLLRPGVQTLDVTIQEGLTIRQIAAIFQREMEIDSAEFVRLCGDSSFAADLGVSAKNLEGYLFPDTYNFYRYSSAADIIRKMTSAFHEVFSDTLIAKLKSVDLSLHEAVTLASIIEGEVMVDAEAPTVSAVYHNRLRKRMLLGADPTIQYIIPDGPRRLLNRDLDIDSPYNTYKHRGLPPGPINNPGKAALYAALNPADVDYIYFVAKGDGTHAFNSTHQGHARDKAKFQKVRRQVAREKRRANNH